MASSQSSFFFSPPTTRHSPDYQLPSLFGDRFPTISSASLDLYKAILSLLSIFDAVYLILSHGPECPVNKLRDIFPHSDSPANWTSSLDTCSKSVIVPDNVHFGSFLIIPGSVERTPLRQQTRNTFADGPSRAAEVCARTGIGHHE